MSIIYIDSKEQLDGLMLDGFFAGWPSPPSEEDLRRTLKKSTAFIVAAEGKKAVGFINAFTDWKISAFIPLLEVLPEYQGRGIGGKLVELMLDKLKEVRAIDLVCDDGLIGFYERFGMAPYRAMIIRKKIK